MTFAQAATIDEARKPMAAWGPVFAMSLGAFALVASEFMPVSLLTPIAADLGISEGQAGQAISVSGAFAVITSLSIAALARRLDRKLVLLFLTLLVIVSGAVVALAPNYTVFMIGRALIGVAIGGFWSMSAATAMRLVPAEDVTKALAIFNGGNALATVLAAPLGSFLGGVIGWRGAFFCVVPIALVVLVWQMFSMPSLKAEAGAKVSSTLALLKRPAMAAGMLAVSLFFMGQFALFTYLRPFLETVTHVGVATLSILLLVMGVMGFIGTAIIGVFLGNRLHRTLIIVPAAMAGIGVALIMFGASLTVTALLLALWGLLATSAPVAWWSWLAKTAPDDAESAGGLMVAIIQLAITLGAIVGGLLFDASGHVSTFAVAALVLVLAALGARLTARQAS